MKVSYSAVGGHEKHLSLSSGLKDAINLLIIAHIAMFVLYTVVTWMGSVDMSFRQLLALSSREEHVLTQWTTSIITYQFVHHHFEELLMSMGMLWLFGHILQNRVGQTKVVALYFIFATMSAIVFNVSHLIFPVFSGPGDFMEGAFGGVLGVMTVAVFLYGKTEIFAFKRVSVLLWHIYLAAVFLSFIFICKNNIAYILMYICSIYAGARYAGMLKVQHENEGELPPAELKKAA